MNKSLRKIPRKRLKEATKTNQNQKQSPIVHHQSVIESANWGAIATARSYGLKPNLKTKK